MHRKIKWGCERIFFFLLQKTQFQVKYFPANTKSWKGGLYFMNVPGKGPINASFEKIWIIKEDNVLCELLLASTKSLRPGKTIFMFLYFLLTWCIGCNLKDIKDIICVRIQI